MRPNRHQYTEISAVGEAADGASGRMSAVKFRLPIVGTALDVSRFGDFYWAAWYSKWRASNDGLPD
jgi:hypothetical protein